MDANLFLLDYLPRYNRKFAALPRSTGEAHIHLDPTIDLDFLFSIHSYRIISKDLQIQFDNVIYQIITNRPPQHLSGRDALVTQASDGSVSAYLNHTRLSLAAFHKQPKQAQIVSSKSLEPNSYSPPVNHPWRTYGKKLNGLPVLVSDQ